MSHHKKHSHPVPPGNQPKAGPAELAETQTEQRPAAGGETAATQQQDAKRRLGDFEGAGEHPYQQPGGLNDANH